MTLREELLAQMREWGVRGVGDLRDDTPLISEGRLDSIALFSLTIWIEEKRGSPIDPTKVDIAREWDSIEKVVAFCRNESATRVDVLEQSAISSDAAPTPMRAAIPMLPTDYQIVPYAPQYRAAALALLKRLWSDNDALNARFFDWRYADARAPAPPIVLLALFRGEPVGIRALHAQQWMSHGRCTARPWYFADDLVIAEAHENQGLFAAFSATLRNELARVGQTFFLSLSALRVTRIQSLAGGALSVGPFETLGRIASPSRALDQLRSVAQRAPLAWRLADVYTDGELASSAFGRLDSSEPLQNENVRIEVRTEVPAYDLAALVSQLPNDGRFVRYRDTAFFAWRYANPLHEYRHILARDSAGELLGYLVLERALAANANPRRMHIADWEARDPSVAAALLDYLIAATDAAELVNWAQCCMESQRAALVAAGFARVDVSQYERGLPSLLVWPTDSNARGELALNGQSLLELERWNLRLGDTSYA
jgi:acyl carrier protein